MRVAICVPCYGDPKYKFVLSLLALQKAALSDGSIDAGFGSVQHSLIGHARERLAEMALKERPDYLFWLDADMTFPADALVRLVSHNLPVVAANYRKRDLSAKTSSARALDGGTYRPIEPKGDGLEEVDAVGLGVCLMRADVFHGLPRPWFVAADVGEDTFFFRRLKEVKGIRPVVDHGLSTKVGHIAEVPLMF